MIFCNSEVYAKVWEVKPSEKYLDVQFSTSEKQQDGTYKYSRWFGRAIGHAFNSMKDKVKAEDKIKITKCKITNEPYTDKDGNKKFVLRVLILEVELPDAAPAPVEQAPAQQTATTATEDSPW